MPTYNTSISRDGSDDPLIPVPVAQEIIKAMPQQSAVMNLARTVTMSSKTWRQPVLSVLPQAYWVSGDTGMKQTSSADWQNVTLTAEELAVLVPIPDAYLADSQVPIWDEVRPLITEAIAAKFDAAALFGTDKPSTFPTGVYLHAIAAGNGVIAGTGDDYGVDVASVAQEVAEDGFNVNGFISKPGFNWQLTAMRTTDGHPIYQPNLEVRGAGTLYGEPLRPVANGAWDATEALLIAGDWTKAIVGVRQDITFTRHDSGIISDDSGNVVFNAMQQDATIFRAVFRAGFALANPVTRLQGTESARSPFGALQATTAAS